MTQLVRLVQILVGYFARFLAEIKIPKLFREFIFKLIGEGAFGMDLAEAELPICEYQSFQDLFTRKVKQREIQSHLVSPVDGLLRSKGRLEDQKMPDVKLVPSEILKSEISINTGKFALFYLSPRDYHRVHSPCDMVLKSIKHIPGMFWPVNKIGLKICPKIYSTNERVVFHFVGEAFEVYLIMVAALNVGGIVCTVSGEQIQLENSEEVKFNQSIKAGDEIGFFKLGSAVVFIHTGDGEFLHLLGEVSMGEAL